MILTLIIKRGIGIRILKHDSDFELKNAPQVKLKNKSAILLMHTKPEDRNTRPSSFTS
jgi:hypothetical protein